MNKIWVMSLGGSRIIPDKVDIKFLREFRKIILSHKEDKFVIVTGGGSTARIYMSALKALGKNEDILTREGVAITRHHAEFMMKYFGDISNDEIPLSRKKVRNLLSKNRIVFCGALRHIKDNTTDGTAAELAEYFKSPLINLTNVKGLYTSNPKENKSAKFISKINWEAFDKMASKIKFKAGQHFVLDQSAAGRIKEKKIDTYIVGNLKSLDRIFKGEKFVGTLVSG